MIVVMENSKMTDDCLRSLLRLRLKNQKASDAIKKIGKIVYKSNDGFRAIVKWKVWGDSEEGMTLNKLYLNEVEFLLKKGILKIENDRFYES